MEDKITVKTVYDKACKKELAGVTYKNSVDTVKKGDRIDTLALITGWIALVCVLVIFYLGVTGYFSMTMKYLLVIYVLIIVWCFVKPVPQLVSKCMWRAGFKKRFPVNKGADENIVLDRECMIYKKNGEEIILMYDNMYHIYDTANYVVLHNNDKEIFAIKKSEPEELDVAGHVYELLSDKPEASEAAKVDDMPAQEAAWEDDEAVAYDSYESEAEYVTDIKSE